MLKRVPWVACFAVLFSAAFMLQAEEKAEDKADEPKAKCPVSGKEANMDVAVEFNDGKVYMCCEGCPDAFKADLEKYTPLANHQFLVTKQAKQTKCPLSGGKLNPDAKVKVGDVEVGFCCMNCQGKVAKAEGDEQIALVFGPKPFEKGFEMVKEEEEDKE